MRCIAIDDEPLALKQLQAYVEKTPFLELAGLCSNAFAAMKMISEQPPELLFVDINMPELNGVDFVRSLSGSEMVIFTTAYSEYALEGFQVSAVDYLLKPISYADFLKAATKAQQLASLKRGQVASLSPSDDDYLFVKSEYKTVRIPLSEVEYVEGMKEYVCLHLSGKQNVTTLLSMKALEEKLPADKFIRIHRSFMVNLSKITAIERQRVVIGKEYLPVGEQYSTIFFKRVGEKMV
ncbi:MAG: LytTR family DNA-binding domain-containing protein [Prevotellaceae bacterium]|nr:LytTR family DNA-binding domain-containing protein [Prevotellaceae bacterium]